VRSDLKTACTPSAVARSVRRSRCSSRSVSPSLARSDCTAGEPLSACVRSASRSVPAGGSGVDAVIPQLWRGVLTRGGVAEWRTRAGLGFWDARTERSNLPRLVASSASPLPPLPPLPRLPRGRGLRAPFFRPAKNVKKPRLELVQKVHLTSSNRRS